MKLEDCVYRKLRHLPRPEVVVCDSSEELSGFYVSPDFGVFYYNNKEWVVGNGLIFILNNQIEEEDLYSTLLHEYRHHYQWWKYGPDIFDRKKTGYLDWFDLYEKLGYDEAIKKYFLYNKIELDALLFGKGYFFNIASNGSPLRDAVSKVTSL